MKIVTTAISGLAAVVFLWGTMHQIGTQQEMNATFKSIQGQVHRANELTTKTLVIVSPLGDIASGVEAMNAQLSTGVIPSLHDANNTLKSITDQEGTIVAALSNLNTVTSNTVSAISKIVEPNHKVLVLTDEANRNAVQELSIERNLNALTTESINQLAELNKKLAPLGMLP